MTEPLRTRPYTVSRATIAWIAAEEYGRRFWWIVAIVPAFGVGTLLLIDHPTARVFGVMGVMWPFSIPARGVIATIKAGPRFQKEVFLEVLPELLRFHKADGGGWKLRIAAVRHVVRMRGYYVLRLSGLGFVPVPESAFVTAADAERFEQALEAGR